MKKFRLAQIIRIIGPAFRALEERPEGPGFWRFTSAFRQRIFIEMRPVAAPGRLLP